MSTSDPKALIRRLRHLADELESADRYGVPLPPVVNVDGYENGGATFHAATYGLFGEWATYTEVDEPEVWDDGDTRWHRARADVNGLRLWFATSRPLRAEEVSR